MTASVEARDPEFDEIIVKVKEAWQTREAQTELTKRGTDLKEAIDAWILKLPELKEDVAAAEKKKKENIEADIKTQELDRAKEEHKVRIEGIEQRHDFMLKGELAPKMKPHHAKAFEAVAKEQKLEIGKIGPIARNNAVQNPKFPEGISDQEKMNRILRSNVVIAGLGSLDEGAITQHPSQVGGGDYMLMMVCDKKTEPAPAEMLGYPKRIESIYRTRQERGDRTWSYSQFKLPEFLSLKSKSTDDSIAESERRAVESRERAEKRRLDRQRAQREREARMNPKPNPVTPDGKTPKPNPVTPDGTAPNKDEVPSDVTPPVKKTGEKPPVKKTGEKPPVKKTAGKK